MKKTIQSLFALAVAAFAFTACSDVPEPEGYNSKTGDGLVTYVAEGTGTATDPYNVAGIVDATKDLNKGETTTIDIYAKGYVSEVTDFNASYGNISYSITDNAEGKSKKFIVYRGLALGNTKFAAKEDLKVGDEVIICGKVTNYNGTIEYAQGNYLVSLNGKKNGGDDPTPTPTGENLLINGDFETWADGLPTEWKSASTASSSTLSQSTDAHGGSYSVNFAGDEANNKRLAYKELTLKAGTYAFKFFVKSTTADPAQVRPGYVPVTDGKVGSYTYGDYATISTEWTEVTNTFTLTAQTTVCLVIMNPKASSYSSGKDVLIDDASLVTSDGGIVDGENTGGNDPQPSNDVVTATIAEFNAAAESTSVWYQLTGTVKNLKAGDLYGNFDLEDATGSVYVYGLLKEKGGAKKLFQELANEQGIAEGSTITIIGNRGSYNGKIEVTNAYFVSISK